MYYSTLRFQDFLRLAYGQLCEHSSSMSRPNTEFPVRHYLYPEIFNTITIRTNNKTDPGKIIKAHYETFRPDKSAGPAQN